MSKARKPEPEATKAAGLVLQKLADLQSAGKRMLFLAPSWSEDAFALKSTVPAEPSYCFHPVPDYLLAAEVQLSGPAASEDLSKAIESLAKQGYVQVEPMRLQDHDDFAYRRPNGEVLQVQVSPLDGSATIRVHASWPPRPDRPVLHQNTVALARSDGQHLGYGCRITDAGLQHLAHPAEPEPQPRSPVEPKSATTFTATQVATRYGVDVDTVYGWLRTGLLPSVNVASKSGSRKPRYLIRQQDINQFEQVRATKAPAPGRSRKQKDSGAEKFF